MDGGWWVCCCSGVGRQQDAEAGIQPRHRRTARAGTLDLPVPPSLYGFMPMGLLVPGRDQTANSIGRECGIELRRRSAWVVDPCTMSAHGPRGACPRVGRRTIRAAGRAEG